ncbi:MAG: alpha/beta hydrolase [bacterium]
MKRTTFPEQYLDFDGCRIRYIDIGAGDPILFLHGLGGKIEDNDACFRYLENQFRVVAMDCPGSGFSDKPDRDYDMPYMVDFALDFATRLGLEKFYVAGGSQGGMHTLLCCHRAPERIHKAAIYSSSGVWPANPLLVSFVRSLPPEAVRPFFRMTSLFWHSPFYPDYWESRTKDLEFLDSREMPGFGRHVLGCLASQFERDYRKIYAEVNTPVLILWGDQDFGMPVRMGRELNRILPDSRLIEVAGAGHNVPIEKPEYFAGKIAEFFKI